MLPTGLGLRLSFGAFGTEANAVSDAIATQGSITFEYFYQHSAKNILHFFQFVIQKFALGFFVLFLSVIF